MSTLVYKRNENHDNLETIGYIATCEDLNVKIIQHYLHNIRERRINLSGHGIGDGPIEAIAINLSSNVNVTSLDLTDNSLAITGAKHIGSIFEKNYFIQRLSLSRNHIKSEGAVQLFRFIENCGSLKYLSLSDNQIDDNIAVRLGQFLTLNKTVIELDLSKNNLCKHTGYYICKGLEVNHRLKVLDLRWNQLSPKSAANIVKSLRTNTCLEYLNLSWNGINDDICSVIGESLTRNGSLQELDLSFNSISSDGASSISSGLISNTTLKVLRLKRNLSIKPDGIHAILESLRRNSSTGMKNLDLEGICASEQNKKIYLELKKTKKDFELNVVEYKKCKIVRTWRDHVTDLLKDHMAKKRLDKKELFNLWNMKKEEGLSRFDFAKGITECKLAVTRWQIDLLISWLDKNNSGKIEYKEFCALFD